MQSIKKLAAVALLLAGCAVVDPVPEGSLKVSQAWTRGEAVPLLSPSYGETLTTDAAYRIQYNALHQVPLSRAPEGFKAALTNPASQQTYAATGPLAAVLPAGSELKKAEDGYHVKVRDYRQPLVEVELGFRFAERVRYPLPDVRALQAVVSEVLPAIELPDLAHAGSGNFRPVDIIATNAGARHFIAGPGRSPSVNDPNAVAITLYRDGEVVTQGGGRDVLGDQWQALLWLVNRTLASGWTIEPGQVLITGTLGKPTPLQTGIYVADFGRLGRIEWFAE